MSQDKIDIFQRALEREKKARKQAEKILEEKSAELYETNLKLEKSNSELESLYKKTNSQLQGVFENIVDAYVIIDLNGNILKLNDAAVELLGFESDDVDFNLIQMADSSEIDRTLQSFKDLIKEGSLTDFKVKINTRKNEKKLVHINASVIYDDGVAVAAQGIVRDVTLVEKLMNQLEKTNDELQEYAHIVSHDLKSPLRSINALVSWLKEDNKDKLDESSLQNIAHIETTLEKMEQLINDILNYSSSGAETYNKEMVDIRVLVDDIVKLLYVPEHIEISVLGDMPQVHGDKTKLQQVFQNLISNAIKFIDKEKGLINIKSEELDTHYKFSIKDNGIGIEKKFYDKIFKIFHSLNASKQSTGIGLSIVKKIVELHEGEVWLESEPTLGTTFYFTLKK